MTKYAQNSINLFKGQDAKLIAQVLREHNPAVVKEIKEHFKTTSIRELAARLSTMK